MLTEIGLPQGHFVLALIAFNVGVELAQLTVIALCLAAVGWALHRDWYQRAIVMPVSAAIAFTAFYWILERGGALT